MKKIMAGLMLLTGCLVYAGNSSSSGLVGQDKSLKLKRIYQIDDRIIECFVHTHFVIKTENSIKISQEEKILPPRVINIIDNHNYSSRIDLEELCENSYQKDYVYSNELHLISCKQDSQSSLKKNKNKFSIFINKILDESCH